MDKRRKALFRNSIKIKKNIMQNYLVSIKQSTPKMSSVNFEDAIDSIKIDLNITYMKEDNKLFQVWIIKLYQHVLQSITNEEKSMFDLRLISEYLKKLPALMMILENSHNYMEFLKMISMVIDLAVLTEKKVLFRYGN